MSLQEQNAKRWTDCHISTEMGPAFEKVANRLVAADAKARYQKVEKITGVPWWFIAVVHQREASQNWSTQLGQGDPLSKKSTHIPKGRGPFKTWEEGAVDALVNCAPFAARNKDWSIGGSLAMLEKYNGLGYYNKGVPSPYIWAGTNQYTSGKYVADGVYNPSAVDTQLGCAGLLKFMGVFNKSATIGAGPVIAATGGTVLYSYWQTFQSHWVLYTLGILTTAFIVDCLIYAYRTRKH